MNVVPETESLNHTVSEKLCAYLIQKSSQNEQLKSPGGGEIINTTSLTHFFAELANKPPLLKAFRHYLPLKMTLFLLLDTVASQTGSTRDRTELKTWVVHIHYQPSSWLQQQRYVTNKWIRAAMLMRK